MEDGCLEWGLMYEYLCMSPLLHGVGMPFYECKLTLGIEYPVFGELLLCYVAM